MGNMILTDRRVFLYAQAVGTLSVLLLGMTAALALVIGAIWLVSQLLLLAIESFLQAFHTVIVLYQASSSFTQLCLLLAFSFAGYYIGKRILARKRVA